MGRRGVCRSLGRIVADTVERPHWTEGRPEPAMAGGGTGQLPAPGRVFLVTLRGRMLNSAPGFDPPRLRPGQLNPRTATQLSDLTGDCG